MYILSASSVKAQWSECPVCGTTRIAASRAAFYYQLPPHIAARPTTGHTSPKANALTGAIPIAPSRSIRRQACSALTNLRP